MTLKWRKMFCFEIVKTLDFHGHHMSSSKHEVVVTSHVNPSENTVAPRSSSTMPASVNENVTASLLLSLSTKCGPENGEIPLEQRMAAASKRVLVKEVQYEVSNTNYHNSVLQGLKAKYTDQNDNETNHLNGTNSSMGVAKGSVDPSSPCLPTPAKVLFPADRVQMQWPGRCANGSGFTNAGNSCYLNSVLQALFHIPPMVNWLMEGDVLHQRSCGTMLNSTTECIVCCMAVTLKNSQQRSGSDMRPHLILARLRSICKRLMPGQQEDAMEFLRYLFEAMEKSYLSRFSNTKLDSNSKETTPLNQIFGGYIRTDVTCLHCRGVSTTFQHFLDLTLDISRGPSLEHALDTYFCQERLEGENSYRCDKCRRKVPAAKQFFIERLPNVLCIQLKRFSIEGKKISKCVQLAERINLQRFLSRPKTGPSQGPQQLHRPPRGACYRLQAGVNHLGHTAQSGHYTTTAYTSSGNLYLFDDSCVQRYWSRSFSGTDVYLLMYMLETPRQDCPRPGVPPSATTTSQTLQPVTPRLPTKATITPFIPAQCRSKPPTILSNNRKMFSSPLSLKEPLVAPTKSPTELPKSKHLFGIENKPSKLVNPSPQLIKDTNVASVSPNKSNVQTPGASSSYTPVIERVSMKARNGQAPNMPSLVPYPEENSSGDEGDIPALIKVPSKEPSASTNGWTVTKNGPNSSSKDLSSDIVNSDKQALASVESSKKIVKTPESPKKVNGLDVQSKKNSPKICSDSVNNKKANKPVINNSETFNGKKSSDGDTSSLAESDSSVRSTVTAWHVSSESKSPNKEKVPRPKPCLEPRGGVATANWEVTSAPTSAEQSPGAPLPSPSSSPPKPLPNREQQHNGGVKRKQSRRRSSSSSSSDSSSSSSSSDSSSRHRKKVKKEAVWVERTFDTINGDHKKSGGVKRPANETYRPPVTDELRKMSHAGYGGAQVSTWNGGRSLVERQIREEYYESRRNFEGENEYDPEMDAGRRKKMKTGHYKRDGDDGNYSKGNRFQKEADYRRNHDYDDRNDKWNYKRYSGDYHNQNKNWRPYNNTPHHHNRSNHNGQRSNHHNNRHNDYSRGGSNNYDSRKRYYQNSGKHNGHRHGHH